jgi:hypothetical protein
VPCRYNIIKRTRAAITYGQKSLRATSQMLRAYEEIEDLDADELTSVSALAGLYVRETSYSACQEPRRLLFFALDLPEVLTRARVVPRLTFST